MGGIAREHPEAERGSFVSVPSCTRQCWRGQACWPRLGTCSIGSQTSAPVALGGHFRPARTPALDFGTLPRPSFDLLPSTLEMFGMQVDLGPDPVEVAEICSTSYLVEIGPNVRSSSDFDQSWPGIGHIGPDVGRAWAENRRVHPK